MNGKHGGTQFRVQSTVLPQFEKKANLTVCSLIGPLSILPSDIRYIKCVLFQVSLQLTTIYHLYSDINLKTLTKLFFI